MRDIHEERELLVYKSEIDFNKERLILNHKRNIKSAIMANNAVWFFFKYLIKLGFWIIIIFQLENALRNVIITFRGGF